MIHLFEDIEINWFAAAIAAVFTMLFLGMIWKLSLWQEYPVKYKVIMSIIILPLLYYVVNWRLNKE